MRHLVLGRQAEKAGTFQPAEAQIFNLLEKLQLFFNPPPLQMARDLNVLPNKKRNARRP
jgi:hypothetical protein